ncbi:MAG: hypothetical protein ACREPR_23915 [Brasilonema sp.]
MVRNIRRDELTLENVLSLVDALLQLSEQQSESKLPLCVVWEADKLRITGYEIQQTSRNRTKTTEVGTKKEHLLNQIKNAGKSLNLPKPKEKSSFSQKDTELQEVQTALDWLKELGVREDEKSDKTHGYWKFRLTLKHQTATREENLEVLKQKWKEHPKTNSKEISQTAQTAEKSFDWQEICRTMLEKQKQMTTNRLMRADEMLFDIKDICVDLALVKRKQQDKRSGEDNPEKSQLYKPDYEETQKLEYKDFLAQVLKSQQNNKIAIIGEPGAGKTTLLQRIAFWILNNTDDLPIWIPLGNLPTPAPKFKEYLLNDWLEDAVVSVTPGIKAEFEKLLMAGRDRKQLNAKLKELALAAIDNEKNRFCLREKSVEGVLGDKDGCVFQMALKVGWLNQVGVDAKNPNQPVYAFFHPTFEEYFAALAIANWHFFLN